MSTQTTDRATAWCPGSGEIASGRQGSGVVLSRQVTRCQRFVAEHPGAGSPQVQQGVGIRHPSQVSRVLNGLERDRLLYTVRDRRSLNAWQVTELGAGVLAGLPEAIYE